MARRLVLCLDPGRLLKPPCPVLYPEWGEELLVLSPGMTLAEWSRCASAISAVESIRASVEVWHLIAASAWRGHGDLVATMLADMPAPVQSRLRSPMQTIVWMDAPIDDLDRDGLILRAEFKGQAPADAGSLVLRRLLPLGIRVLLDRGDLLRAINLPSRPLRSVSVLAVGSELLAAEQQWAVRLAGVRDALTSKRDAERDRACEQALLDPELFAGLSVAIDLEPTAPLRLRFFHRVGRDDRAIADWFDSAARRLDRAWNAHRLALARQMAEAIGRLAVAEAPRVSGGAEVRTCEAVRNDVRRQLAEMAGRDEARLRGAAGQQSAQQWIAAHRVPMLHAARRRATRRVFWGGTGLAALAVAAANLIGIRVPAASSWAWAQIVYPAVGSLLAIGLASITVAAWYWLRARWASRSASDGLTRLTEGFRLRAQEAVAVANRDVRHMTTMRNLALLDRACSSQNARLAQIEAHIDFVRKLLDPIGGVPSTPAGRLAPVDTERRPESVTAYMWVTDTPRVDVRAGSDSWSAAKAELHGLLRRYAGASAIEIERRP